MVGLWNLGLHNIRASVISRNSSQRLTQTVNCGYSSTVVFMETSQKTIWFRVISRKWKRRQLKYCWYNAVSTTHGSLKFFFSLDFKDEDYGRKSPTPGLYLVFTLPPPPPCAFGYSFYMVKNNNFCAYIDRFSSQLRTQFLQLKHHFK